MRKSAFLAFLSDSEVSIIEQHLKDKWNGYLISDMTDVSRIGSAINLNEVIKQHPQSKVGFYYLTDDTTSEVVKIENEKVISISVKY